MKLALFVGTVWLVGTALVSQAIDPVAIALMIGGGSLLSFLGGFIRCRRSGCPLGDAMMTGLAYWSIGVCLGLVSVMLIVEWTHPAASYVIGGGLGLLPWIGAEVWDRIGESVLDRIASFFNGGRGDE